MNDIIHIEQGSSQQQRADEIREEINQVRLNMEDGFFALCDLLYEVVKNNYHVVWGYARFADWVQFGSNLDMSSRQAEYYAAIAKKSQKLGIDRDLMRKVKISALKEIFSLNPEEHGEEMERLILDAQTASYEEIKARVRALKGQDGEEPMIYMTIKVAQSIKETIQNAFELARMNYGDEVEGGDISDTKCMEIICLSFVQDLNNNPE